MSRQRVIRQNVHDDRLHHASDQAMDYARTHGRNLAIGVGVLAVLVIGYFAWQAMSKGGEETAAMELLQARTDFNQNLIDPAATKLTSLIQRHGNTPSGTRARLLMGDVELKRGNHAQAEARFREYLSKTGSSDYLWTNGQRGLAVALENQARFKEAAKAYEDLLKGPLGDEERAHALLDAARAHALGGDTSSARLAYERITKEFGTTRAALQAKILLAETGQSGTS